MVPEDRSHELLVLWMELNRAVGRLQNKGILNILPWSCKDKAVKLAWKKVTEPKNLHALKEWLEVASTEKSRIWTQKAIEDCRRRIRVK
jgi:hypothetical protein